MWLMQWDVPPGGLAQMQAFGDVELVNFSPMPGSCPGQSVSGMRYPLCWSIRGDFVWSRPRFNCLAPFQDIAVLVFRALTFYIKYPIESLDL